MIMMKMMANRYLFLSRKKSSASFLLSRLSLVNHHNIYNYCAAAPKNKTIIASWSSRANATSATTASSCIPRPQSLLVHGRKSNLSPTSSFLSLPQQQQQKQQQKRWKRHAASKGNHLEVLDDMAHQEERDHAKEKRQKKKERKLKKKNKGGMKGNEEEDEEDDALHGTAAFAMEKKTNDDDDDDHHHHHDDDNEDEDAVELPDPKKILEKMMTIVQRYEESLKSIRGAEPTPELFDDIMVNAYGSDTALKSVAQVVITSPTMASVTCFDPSLVKEVRASIQLQLGLNPQSDASEGDLGVLKVPLPKVSLESRQKTASQLNKKAESFRQRLRRVRRRYNGIIKQGKEGKLEHVSKDDVFRVAKEIDDATEKAVKHLNDVTDKKHDSIMNVQ